MSKIKVDKETHNTPLSKSYSDKRIAHDTEYRMTEGMLMQYRDEAKPIGFTPRGDRILVKAGESLEKYQNGIIVLKIKIKGKDHRILVQMDGLLSVIYECYQVQNPFKFGEKDNQ